MSTVAELEPVAWGVLGVADIAVTKVIPAMAGSSLGTVSAIASRSAERAAAAADLLGLARWYGSYQELLADPAIEAVYNPLPNHLHAEWTIAALEAGKHVLCEKPLATSVADARRMIAAARGSGRLLMEAFMYRLHPLWVRAVELVRAGAIGEPSAVQIVFSYFNDDPDDIRNISAAGGGALFDIGCYAVDVARLVFDSEPTEVLARVRRDPALGTDVLTSALLDFDGRHATFVCSTRTEDAQRVEILGTDGRLVIEIPFNIPPDRPTRLLVISGGSPPVDPGVEVIELPAADPYRVQADAFSRAIRLGLEVPVPPADSVATLEVIETVFAAGATRAT